MTNYTTNQIEALKNVKYLAKDGYDNNHVLPNKRTYVNYQHCMEIMKQELPDLFSIMDGNNTCVVNRLCLIRGLAWKALLSVDECTTY